MTRPDGASGYARRIKSLALTSAAGSVFRTVRPDRIDALASRIASALPYASIDDEGLYNTVTNIACRDKSYFIPLHEVEAKARASRYLSQSDEIEIRGGVFEAIAKMTADEKLAYVNEAQKMPSRFKFRETVVADIGAALAACSPLERIRYQSDPEHPLPSHIKIVESEKRENENAVT